MFKSARKVTNVMKVLPEHKKRRESGFHTAGPGSQRYGARASDSGGTLGPSAGSSKASGNMRGRRRASKSSTGGRGRRLSLSSLFGSNRDLTGESTKSLKDYSFKLRWVCLDK